MTTRTFFVRVVLLYGCRRGTESPREKRRKEKRVWNSSSPPSSPLPQPSRSRSSLYDKLCKHISEERRTRHDVRDRHIHPGCRRRYDRCGRACGRCAASIRGRRSASFFFGSSRKIGDRANRKYCHCEGSKGLRQSQSDAGKKQHLNRQLWEIAVAMTPESGIPQLSVKSVFWRFFCNLPKNELTQPAASTAEWGANR